MVRYGLALVLLLTLSLFLGACGAREHIVAFPKHDEPLSTVWAHGDYIRVDLVVENGCLRAQGPSPSYLLVWPDGFTLNRDDGYFRISDRSDTVVVSVGDEARFSGRLVLAGSDLAQEIAVSIPEECTGPYFLIGDDVTSVDSDEPEMVSIPGSSLFFPREQTLRTKPHGVEDTLELHSGPFELVLEDDCLIVNDGEKYVIRWPAGFHPYIDDNGAVNVRNGGGHTIARVGDRLRFRGGKRHDVDIPECEISGLWYVKDIRNIDLPVVFAQYEKSSNGIANSRISGYIELHNGCLYLRKHILVWPSNFSVEESNHNVQVFNEGDQIVAQIGEQGAVSRSTERLTFKGRQVSADDDFGPQIRRILPIDCPHGPFWFVD